MSFMAEQKKENKKGLKILAAGDFHGDSRAAEKLAEKAEKEHVDLVILSGDIQGHQTTRGMIHPFQKRGQKVVFIPGNWDTSVEAAEMRDTYGIKNIDCYHVNYNGVDIVGIGSPDWKLELNEKKTLAKLEKIFEKLKDTDSPKVLVSHLHAAGSLAEFSGIPGDIAVAKAMKYLQPDVLIASHIHEAEGLEQKIGKTRIFQVGKKGKIIEVK
jgi:Icc-related predicted phosphoesterase